MALQCRRHNRGLIFASAHVYLSVHNTLFVLPEVRAAISCTIHLVLFFWWCFNLVTVACVKEVSLLCSGLMQACNCCPLKCMCHLSYLVSTQVIGRSAAGTCV